MNAEIPLGLACGLVTALVSEAVLRLGAPTLKRRLFSALAIGAGLRALWVLALVAWSLSSDAIDARAYVLALLAGYLASQVFEGVRYTRYFERC